MTAAAYGTKASNKYSEKFSQSLRLVESAFTISRCEIADTKVYLPWVNTCIAKCLNSVLNVKALVGALLCDCEIFVNLRLDL